MKERMAKKSVIACIVTFALLAVLSVSCSGEQTHKLPSHRFDDIATWVKVFEDPERDAWQQPDEVIKTMNIAPGNVVADIGAGTGYFTRRFAVAVGPEGKALGLDIEQSMIEYMNEDARKLKLSNYTARAVRVDDPELSPRTVDILFLCNTYHHIDDRVTYFRNVAESLKPGGRLIIVDFYKKELPYGPPPSHKLSKDAVIKELQMAGYRLKKELHFLPYQYYLEFGL